MGRSQPTSTPFSVMLRHARREAGLSQGELAERAGLSMRGVSDLERGVIRRARRETVQLLADALQLGPQARADFEAAARVSAYTATSLPSPSSHLLAIAHLPRFVGREQEIARVEQHLAAADHAVTSVLFFAGEPGIGKSRLLHEAAVRAASSGWRVLAGGCTRRGGQEPFTPFVDTLARAIAQQPPSEQRRELQGCAWLVRLLPELLESAVVPAPSWSLPPEQERRLMFAAVARYLANIAGPSGTLLVLDDMQWAGADALDLLESLARIASEGDTQQSPIGQRLRIIAAYRSSEVDPDHPLATTQADLARVGLAARSALSPLSPADATALAEDLLAGGEPAEVDAGELVERLVGRAGRVPFYLVNCAQTMRLAAPDDGGLEGTKERRGGTAVQKVPWTVAETIRQRTTSLPKQSQDLLAVAAVIGRVVSHALLEAATASSGLLPEGALPPALDAAVRAHLLMEPAEGREQSPGAVEYQFAHDLIHEVILHDLGVARRLQLHRVVAIALEQLAAAKGTRERLAAELADHFLQASELARALSYVLLAGDHAEAVNAHAEAERHFRSAAELAVEVGDLTCEAEALEKAGIAVSVLGRGEQARTHLERAVDLYEALGDHEGTLRTVACLLNLLGPAGLELGLTFAKRIEADGSFEATRGLAAFYATLAQQYVLHSHFQNALDACSRAEQIARTLGDDQRLVEALQWQAMAGEPLGEDVLPALLDLVPLAERAGNLVALRFALMLTGFVYLRRHADLVQAKGYLQRALDVAERRGGPYMVLQCLGDLAEYHYFAGEWDLARAYAERAVAMMRQVDRPTFYDVEFAVGMIDLAEGRHRDAEQHVGRGLAVAEAWDNDATARRWGERLLAERDLVAGLAESAHVRLKPLLDRSGTKESDVEPLLPLVAWAELRLGRDDQAAATLATCKERCGRLWQPDALRVEAMLAIKLTRWEDAARSLDDALSMCRAIPYPYAEAKALYLYGQLYDAQGEPECAREKYQQALAICERLGEGLYRPHIEQALSQ